MKASDPLAPETFEPRCYLPCQVSWITGLDRERIIYPAIRSGRLVARRLGPNVVITDDDLRQWLAALPGVGGQEEALQSPPQAAATRRRLPPRRGAVALDIEHAGHRYRMHVGYFPNGVPGEVFLDAAKQNSTLDAFAADAAILVSLLLQHGVLPDEIGHALRRSPNGAAASVIGAVVDELHATETQQDRSAS